MKWNIDAQYSNDTILGATNQDAQDTLLCEVGTINYDSIPDDNNFRMRGDSVIYSDRGVERGWSNTLKNDVGVAIDGVILGGAHNSDPQDPIFPAFPFLSGQEPSADACGQHSNAGGKMHIHYVP